MFGYLLCLGLLVIFLAQTVLLHQHHIVSSLFFAISIRLLICGQIVIREGIRVRSMMITAIYDKTLRLPEYAKSALTTGRISNLLAIDSTKILDVYFYFHYIWSNPLQILVILGLLVYLLGVVALFGVGIAVLFIPIQMGLTKYQSSLASSATKMSDKRIELSSELIQGMKIVKFYAWENYFLDSAERARQAELMHIKLSSIVRALGTVVLEALPLFLAVSTFVLISMFTDQTLSPQTTFTVLSLFNLLRVPLSSLPKVLQIFAEGRVAHQRIQSFLQAEDIEKVKPNPALPLGAINLYDRTFRWAPDDPNVLTNLRLKVTPSELVWPFLSMLH